MDVRTYYDKRRLRAAVSTAGIMMILYLLFIDVAVVILALGFNLIMNGTFPTNFSEYNEALRFMINYSDNMDIALNGLIQLISLAMTVGCISLFYELKPLEIITPKRKKVNNTENESESPQDEKFKLSFKLIMTVFPIVILINYVTSIFITIVIKIIESNGINVYKQTFNFTNLRLSTVIIYFFALCVFAPIIEEFLFRGCIIRILKPYGNWFAIIVSSLFFSLLHGNIGQSFGTFFMGLILGFVAIKTGSILPTIILHAMNNFIGFSTTILSNLPYSDFSASIFGIIILAIGIVGIVMVVKHANDFTLEKNNTTLFSTKKIYATFFLNFFVIVYIGYEILKLISTFSKA